MTPAPVEAVLDPQGLAMIRSLDPDASKGLVARIVGVYLDDMPIRLTALRAALAAGDAEVLRKTAHAMKSACANVGANALAARCKALEAGAATAAGAACSEMVAAIEAGFAAVAAALRDLPEMAGNRDGSR